MRGSRGRTHERAGGASTRSAGLFSPFRIAEFRALWAAETLSIAGDQLARVALSVLVFHRTGSAALTGLTYALTFVPAFAGGVLLGGLGDRYPRRTVMVVLDLARAGLIGTAAIPGLSLWVLAVLVAVMTLLGGPFRGAQQAVLPDVLTGDGYTAGMAVRNITIQGSQLVGFAGGGVLVAGLNSSTGLALDAGTFLASALLLRAGVRPHTVPPRPRVSFLASTTAAAQLVWRSPELRSLLALCWLAGFYVVPEALAAPYASSLGGGAGAVGLLMASDPAGSVIGGIVFGNWVPASLRIRTLGLLGVVAGLPLIVCLLHPGLVVSMVLFGLSGMAATGYNIQGTASFVRLLPTGMRAQGAGLMTSGLVAVQGIGALAAGVLADHLGAAHTIAIAGVAGALAAVTITLGGRRRDRPAVIERETPTASQPR
ncbi:MAG: MFS transporter [Jatrophihabitantaceae bacterium]